MYLLQRVLRKFFASVASTNKNLPDLHALSNSSRAIASKILRRSVVRELGPQQQRIHVLHAVLGQVSVAISNSSQQLRNAINLAHEGTYEFQRKVFQLDALVACCNQKAGHFELLCHAGRAVAIIKRLDNRVVFEIDRKINVGLRETQFQQLDVASVNSAHQLHIISKHKVQTHWYQRFIASGPQQSKQVRFLGRIDLALGAAQNLSGRANF